MKICLSLTSDGSVEARVYDKDGYYWCYYVDALFMDARLELQRMETNQYNHELRLRQQIKGCNGGCC